MNFNVGHIVTMQDLIEMNSFAVCEPAAATPCDKRIWGSKIKKDENPMNNAYATATLVTEDSGDKSKIRFLSGQLYEAYLNAKLALQRKFGLTDDEEPKTLTELVKRIQDGLFVIPEKYKEKPGYNTTLYLRWRDPAAVEDKAGYDAAKADLKKAYNDADRTIRILTPVEGLKALQDFEAAQAPKTAKK